MKGHGSDDAPSTPTLRSATAPREWLLHVLVLFNVAVAQPLFAVLSHGTAFFVAHAFMPVAMVAFALSLSLLVPAALAALPLLLWPLGTGVVRVVQWLVVFALALLAALSMANRMETSAFVPIAIAAVAALGLTTLYATSQRLRDFLRFASIVAIVFPVSFLFFSPVRDLLGARPAESPDASFVELENTGAPVFLLVFDELSTVSLIDAHGEIDAAQFPNFARLAARATWYRNASANSTQTEIAVPSILTGRHAERDRPPNAAAYPVNLFTLLGQAYDVVSFDHLARLCPDTICRDPQSRSLDAGTVARDLYVVFQHVFLPRQMREKLPPLEGRWSNFMDGAEIPVDTPDRAKLAAASPFGRKAKPHFEAFIASIDADARGKFFFIHSLLPHIPYVFLPDGSTYSRDDYFAHLPGWDPTTNRWTEDADLVAQAYQRALWQTQMLDGLVGTFLDRLDALGLQDDALIVVTSDHGANFVPGIPRRGIDARTWGAGLMVPLFVKLPGQQHGERSDRNVQSIDVAPTILDALGRVQPGFFDGVSALDVASEAPATKQPLPFRGNRIELPADLTPLLLEDAAHKESLFRETNGSVDFRRLAPFGDAIGLPLDRFEIGVEVPVAAVLDVPADGSGAVPGVDFVAASIEGTLEGDARALLSPFLAIVRGGQVVAVAKWFVERDGRSRFHAIASPDSIDAPGDETRIYTIEAAGPSGGGMQLSPLRVPEARPSP